MLEQARAMSSSGDLSQEQLAANSKTQPTKERHCAA